MKCFIDDFVDRKVKAISLVCENCDDLYFEAFDIWELKLDGHYKTYSNFNRDSFDDHFDNLLIMIRRSSIPRVEENIKSCHDSFKWKLHMHNICGVTLFFEDGDTMYASLPYQEEIPNDLKDQEFSYRYNFSEKYIYDDDYLNINITKRNLRGKKIYDQKKLIKIIKDYFKGTYPKTNSVILFGDYATRNYNENSVVSLYVDSNFTFKIEKELSDLLDKSVFIINSSYINIEDKYFKDIITII